jgi:hypothetical protein
MKSSIRTIFGILAIVMSFVLVQDVWAAHIWQCCTVKGQILTITDKTEDNPSSIEVLIGETECDFNSGETVIVYGIPFDKLYRDYGKLLIIDDDVEIEAHECPTSKDEGQLKACAIKLDNGDIIYFNHGGNLKPKNKAGLSRGKR